MKDAEEMDEAALKELFPLSTSELITLGQDEPPEDLSKEEVCLPRTTREREMLIEFRHDGTEVEHYRIES